MAWAIPQDAGLAKPRVLFEGQPGCRTTVARFSFTQVNDTTYGAMASNGEPT